MHPFLNIAVEKTNICRTVGLVQLVRSLVAELNYLDLICVLYLRLIIFLIGDDVSINSEIFLMTDFMNLKIKSTQSFKCAHKNRMYICVYSFN
jgi:hypothetical protein